MDDPIISLVVNVQNELTIKKKMKNGHYYFDICLVLCGILFNN